MWIADVFESEVPVFVSLISQMLWLACDGIDLATGIANFLDNAFFYIAP